MASQAQLPPDVYWPSCVVNLIIRFDKKFSLTPDAVKAFSTADLVAAAAQPEGKDTGSMLILSGVSPDGFSRISGRVPKKASVELPAYRQAGKFNLTFDFKDLPIDPRLVRSASVRIYMDTVAATSYSEGVVRPGAGNNRVSILPPTARPSVVNPSLDNMVLSGTVDTWHVSHTSSGSEITLEGRDSRGILLDSPIKPVMLDKIPLKADIVKVVQAIVKLHPLMGDVQVLPSAPSDWPDGLPSPTLQGNLAPAQTRVRRGANGQQARASAGSDPKNLNFWDLITRYCSLVGAVPYFYGDNQIRIRPARTLYDQQIRAPSPFSRGAARDVGEAQPLTVRRMVFGQNVEELTFERKFNGFTPRTIRVVSYDTSAKARGKDRLLEVRYPTSTSPASNYAIPAQQPRPLAPSPDEAGVSTEAPSGAVGNKDEMLISVPGINDKKRLRQIAEDIFEELGRGEMGGSVKTRSLGSFGGSNADPDLIRLRPGDAVTLTVDGQQLVARAPIVSPLNDAARSDDATLIRLIAERVGDVNLARVIVATSRNWIFELQNTFRVRNVKFDWDVKSGVSVAFDFQNYVEARNAVTPIKAPAANSAAQARAASQSTGRNFPTTGGR